MRVADSAQARLNTKLRNQRALMMRNDLVGLGMLGRGLRRVRLVELANNRTTFCAVSVAGSGLWELVARNAETTAEKRPDWGMGRLSGVVGAVEE